ncbi:DUF397 domain-containing protein [Streptomyces sp. M10(2022)]
MTTTDASATQELAWFKSSYSGAEGGECLEVATDSRCVLVRDSKRVDGPVLAVGQQAWIGLVGLATA